EVVTGRLAGGDGIADRRRKLAAGIARGERAHEGAAAVDCVHADAIAEQRAAGLAPRRIHGEHGDAELVALVEAEAPPQLVGERALAGAAGTGHAENRGRLRVQLALEGAELDGGNDLRERASVAGLELLRRVL